MNGRRITLFAGHYGSGKTNIALNYARRLKRAGEAVAIADLDIVNPYFRAKDSAARLAGEGIDLVVSEFANSNVDFPAMPKEIYALVADRSRRIVMDVGGDDRGALALGRYVPDIVAENDYDMLAVVNAARPLTRTPADTLDVLREISEACSLPFTGVVNNTNLGPKTTAADVLGSVAYAGEIAAALAVPVRFTCAAARLAAGLDGAVPGFFPMEIQKLYYQLSE
ncbi:MAG: hypothetical protein J6T01_06420 [Kiritimatiellae bacterium]|nr:hypothetical protein [Kiritimatiellia bacterium]